MMDAAAPLSCIHCEEGLEKNLIVNAVKLW